MSGTWRLYSPASVVYLPCADCGCRDRQGARHGWRWRPLERSQRGRRDGRANEVLCGECHAKREHPMAGPLILSRVEILERLARYAVGAAEREDRLDIQALVDLLSDDDQIT